MTVYNFIGENLVVAGPRLGDEQPVIDTALRNVTYDDGPPQTAYFSNYNDGMTLTIESDSLVGRTDPGRGPASRINVIDPFILADNRLYVSAEYTAMLEDRLAEIEALLEVRVAELEAQIADLEMETVLARWIG